MLNSTCPASVPSTFAASASEEVDDDHEDVGNTVDDTHYDFWIVSVVKDDGMGKCLLDTIPLTTAIMPLPVRRG